MKSRKVNITGCNRLAGCERVLKRDRVILTFAKPLIIDIIIIIIIIITELCILPMFFFFVNIIHAKWELGLSSTQHAPSLAGHS